MDASQYLKIISAENCILHFQCRGFWSANVIKEFGNAMWSQWERAVASFGGKPHVCLIDLREFKPGPEEGKAFIAQMMKHSQTTGIRYAVDVLASATAQMSINSSSRNAGHDAFRTTVASLEEGSFLAQAEVKEFQLETRG